MFGKPKIVGLVNTMSLAWELPTDGQMIIELGCKPLLPLTAPAIDAVKQDMTFVNDIISLQMSLKCLFITMITLCLNLLEVAKLHLNTHLFIS